MISRVLNTEIGLKKSNFLTIQGIGVHLTETARNAEQNFGSPNLLTSVNNVEMENDTVPYLSKPDFEGSENFAPDHGASWV